jgi:hypothetical protein
MAKSNTNKITKEAPFHNCIKVLLAELMVGDDACLTYSTTGTKIVSLSPSTSVASKIRRDKNYYRNNNELF